MPSSRNGLEVEGMPTKTRTGTFDQQTPESLVRGQTSFFVDIIAGDPLHLFKRRGKIVQSAVLARGKDLCEFLQPN